MVELIVAMTKTGGIGYEGKLPWHIPDELAIFRAKTMNKTLIMGRNTVQTLPKLPGRKIICVTRNRHMWENNSWPNRVCEYTRGLNEIEERDDTLIAGGAQIYQSALKMPNLVQRIHMSVIHGEYQCDTFFDLSWLRDFVITKRDIYDKFTHYVLVRTSYGERQYLDLLQHILDSGEIRTGRNGGTIGIFKSDMTFDLRNGFPLLTTKKMFLRGVIEEFIMFINGRTDTTELSEKKIRIWEGNTSKEFIESRKLSYAPGVMGPMYGWLWRFFGAQYRTDEIGKPVTPEKGTGIDQLANVINLIRTDPGSRRIIMTTYNPVCVEEGVLYPCHSIILQFYVSGKYLDMFCYNRSQDFTLGTPFNIASSALLLSVVAKLTKLEPRFLHMTMGDTHIYDSHREKIKEQLSRIPYQFPTLKILDLDKLDDLSTLQASKFVLENYVYHPAIELAMVV